MVAQTRLYREGLVSALERDPRIQVSGAAADLKEGAREILRHRPNIVLLDIGAAANAGSLCAIVHASNSCQVVAFGAESEQAVIDCAEAGVAGYVPREATLEQLVEVLEGVMRNEVVCSPRVAGTLLRRVGALARERGPATDEVRLTSRETQIAALLEQGLSNKEIATRLQIELATVKNHIHHILEKLGVRRRGEAAARVRAMRSTQPDRLLEAPRI